MNDKTSDLSKRYKIYFWLVVVLSVLLTIATTIAIINAADCRTRHSNSGPAGSCIVAGLLALESSLILGIPNSIFLICLITARIKSKKFKNRVKIIILLKKKSPKASGSTIYKNIITMI